MNLNKNAYKQFERVKKIENYQCTTQKILNQNQNLVPTKLIKNEICIITTTEAYAISINI
jgi:hypothetical protein